ALYAPGLGYYSAGSSKFGEAGDFITAPEISPLFSQCVANQCAEILPAIQQPMIIEVGAGRGTMAADILLQLEQLNRLPKQYMILELSADLRQRQQQTLEQRCPHLLHHVSWLDSLPDKISAIILANELLDALPVHRICHSESGVQEQYVTMQADRFGWAQDTLSDQRLNKIEAKEWPQGYCSEINLAATDWIQAWGDRLEQGVMLLIDYGFPRHEFFHPQRVDGTLMCHYRHRAHDDPFVYPGLQDITAHVDFTSIAEAALSADLSVSGYTTQAMFLMANGLESLLSEQGELPQREQLILSQQVKKLTLPGEMGELFKVMALSKQYNEPLRGFAHDMRGRL
ncbi:MAG: SAM-dependent methyltransferase, partial [Gammaproteobacteria bacterium]|nr:SAM-dependent methyltransferase [Gammaproteobacteria bacterium]